jgi:beta-N-acetylhexosaminidase
MSRKISLTLVAFLVLFLGYAIPLSNNSRQLANGQFEAAKAAFNRQDYVSAQRLASLARLNAPDSAAPWLLIGHCFYLQGQDQAALYHYSMALKLDPQVGPLPPFIAQLRRQGPATTVLALSHRQLHTLRRKIGQMIMVSVPGTKLSGQKKMMLNAGWIGGVILFSQNVQSKAQVAGYVRQLQANAPTPLFVAVDQEGGAVRRFREPQGFKTLPSLQALGRTKDPDLAYRFGRLSGKQLKDVGANLNLAPVVDIDYGLSDSIISKYHRSLGSDPGLVSSLAQEIVKGMKSENIIATAKHFPTQSIASANPHDAVAVTEIPLRELEAKDLVPYRLLIKENLLDSIMLSHVIYTNVDPYFPASLSPDMIQGLLRGRLGYKGLVISDDLKMDAIKRRFPLDISVVQAVNAGVDILLVTDNYERRVMDSLVKAVLSGKVRRKSIDDSYHRIMATKAKYGILALNRAKPKPASAASAPASNLSRAAGQKLAALPLHQ